MPDHPGQTAEIMKRLQKLPRIGTISWGPSGFKVAIQGCQVVTDRDPETAIHRAVKVNGLASAIGVN